MIFNANYFLEKIKKQLGGLDKSWIFMVLACFSLIIFFRFYNLGNWAVFRSDQSRDAFYAREAINKGPGRLKLLGPKGDMVYIKGDKNSRGNTMHMGPLYYYVQYGVSSVFGARTEVLVYLDALMSFLSLFIFYFLARQFFDKKVSLLLSLLYGISFYNILFSRFAWNPNQMFFWINLLALSLYKVSIVQDVKSRQRWFMGAFCSYLILTQLHFIAMFGFLALALFYWVIVDRRKIGWKWLIGAFMLTLVVYSPLIIADINNKGDNARRFFATLQKERGAASWLKNLSKTISRSGEFFSVSIFSLNEKEFLFSENIGSLMFFFSLVLIFWLIYHSRRIYPKTELVNKRKFLILICLWHVFFFLLFFKMADKLSNQRYFLVLSPLFFLTVGFWLDSIVRLLGDKRGYRIVIGIFLTLFFSHLWSNIHFFRSLALGYEEQGFKELRFGVFDDLVTVDRLKEAAVYMVNEAKSSKKSCLYLKNFDYQYNLSMEYLIDSIDSSVKVRGLSDNARDVKGCLLFYLTRTRKGSDDIHHSFLKRFELKKYQSFGGVRVYSLAVKPQFIPELTPPRVEKNETPVRAEFWDELSF